MCNTEIMLEKKEFYIGEDIRIHLKVDNSRSNNSVKSVKVRLTRRFKAKSEMPCETEIKALHEILYYHEPGSRVEKRSTREFDIICKLDPLVERLADKPGFKPEAKKLQPTIQGEIVSIFYELQIFVKHDAWNEWGKGKVVIFPIKLLTPMLPQQPMPAAM